MVGDTKAVSGTTRAVSYAGVKECNQIKQEDTSRNSLLNYITVKGVKLGKSQMIGKDDSKKMAQNNHKNKKNKENETRNATPSSSGIKKYLVRKEENIENDISISPGTENKNNSNKKISPLRKTNKTIIK